MKRLVFLLTAIFFAFIISARFGVLHAQETVIQTDTPIGIDTQATQSSQSTTLHVNYELPYPGMLPDNPLYFLKVIRDGIVKMLINDPFKKAQFSLNVAEKRMYAGKMLVDKDEDRLAVEIIGKSNNYLDDALKAIVVAKKLNPKNPDIRPFLQQFKTAVQKHYEIAEDIKPQIDESELSQFKTEEQKILNAQNKAEAYLRQK